MILSGIILFLVGLSFIGIAFFVKTLRPQIRLYYIFFALFYMWLGNITYHNLKADYVVEIKDGKTARVQSKENDTIYVIPIDSIQATIWKDGADK